MDIDAQVEFDTPMPNHDEFPAAREPEAEIPDVDAQEPAPRMVEVPDQDDEDLWYTRGFPPQREAGKTYGDSKTRFEKIRDDQVLTGEWELAKWLIKNVGHNKTESFLKLPIVADRVKPSFDNKKTFLDNIDSLPIGATWQCQQIPLQGDLVDENNQFKTEVAELWFRDPVECVKELIGNPAFKHSIDYAPSRLYDDPSGAEGSEVINEMSSARWWWKIQERLPDGSTAAPLILSSDKTQLSQFSGDKSAWPVYLTIGNINKDTRRKASSHATILLGYLPVAKMDCYSDAARSVAKYRLFHFCMAKIMQSLADAGANGVEMTCADGKLRKVHPILAAYIADYPEQCLIACCMENRCPMCKVLPTRRGDHVPFPKRDVDETLNYMHRYQAEHQNAQFKKEFITDLGLRPCPPFWAGLPHTDIFEAFTPDLLHQLHKGVFKDHLVSWCTEVTEGGEKEIDARFKSMPSHPAVRHFKNGLSMVSQWTGSEHKEMEKVFACLIAGHDTDAAVIQTATAVIDFIHLASLESHTARSLAALETALDTFHENKQIFLDLGVRAKQKHFNIPKIHSMEHYVAMIWLFGSADGYNTEASERLHIDYAKAGYRASNKKDYIAQMTLWLQRQEAVDRFTAYLAWCQQSLHLKPRTTIAPLPIVTAVPDSTGLEPSAEVALHRGYRIAKVHPAALRGIPISFLEDPAGQNATVFLSAMTTYLRVKGSTYRPQLFDRFDLFKRVTISLPAIPEVNSTPLKLKNVVRASPPVVAALGTRMHPEPRLQDFALIRTGEVNSSTAGTALAGLRVAQVRVLFTMPSYFPPPFNTAGPLAYVEWFTPFSRPDRRTTFHVLRRSTRRHKPYGEIIDVDRIARNCFLVPRSEHGLTDARWTTENAKELCSSFYFNPHLDIHTFCMLKLNHNSCI
ncbi:hypothetical protein C8R46DRAFT_1164909 [Mycena filopes]|nr:hypothetical protein C8R46DRAFT_1164909 [Mycena filopes]